MKHLPLLFLFLPAVPGCGLLNSEPGQDEAALSPCRIQMDINGKPWDAYFPDENPVYVSGSQLTKWTVNMPRETAFEDLDDYLSIACSRSFDSHYDEGLMFF